MRGFLNQKTVVFFVCFVLIILTSFSVNAQKVYEWDLPTVWDPNNYQSVCLRIFADELYERTNGQIKINIHYSGALGYTDPQLLGVVRDGIVPIVDALKNAQTGEEKFFGITALPFLAPGVVELRTLQFFTRPVEDKLLTKHNQKCLYQVPWPSRNVYSKKKIETLEDLKGFKLRVVSKEDSDLFTKLGATPIQMPWGEVVTSLATGVIDGVATSSASGVDGKFWEFLKYCSRWNWHSSEDMVNINLDVWNSLPIELKNIIETTARELEPKFTIIALEDCRNAEKVLIEYGMEVSDPSPEFFKECREVSRSIWEEYMREIPEAKEVIENYMKVMEY